MKVVLITNIPAPYRQKTFQLLSNELGIDNFHVYYCRHSLPDRPSWNITPTGYSTIFLKKNTLLPTLDFNLDIFKNLIKNNPDIIIIEGFNPTMIMAFFWGKIKKKKIVYFSDANSISEKNLSYYHYLIRCILLPKFNAVLGVSKKSIDFYTSYGVLVSNIFITPYSIDDQIGVNYSKENKIYDILFSGQFIARKKVDFFLKIVQGVKEKKKDVRVLLLGGGILENFLIKNLENSGVYFTYLGNLSPDSLFKYYASAKILIFTTEADAWGVVANEACAVGLPVLISDVAGAAGDLIVDGLNGFVLSNNSLEVWVNSTLQLLNNDNMYNTFSNNSFERIKAYSPDVAVKRYVECFNFIND